MRSLRASPRIAMTAMTCALTFSCGGVEKANSTASSGSVAETSSGARTTSGAAGTSDASAPLLKPLWSKNLGPGGAGGAAYDPSGNLVVTGSIFGAFDPSATSEAPPDASCPVPIGCDPDGFLALFDALGHTLLTKRWIGTRVVGPVVGADGHIIVALFPPTDGGVPTGQVAALDAAGSVLWTWNAASGAGVGWLGVDGNSNVFAIGWGGGPPQAAVLTKLDPTGAVLWSQGIGALVGYFGPALVGAVTGSGGVVTLSHLSVGGPDAGVMPLVVAKFGPAGDLLWSRSLQGPEAQAGGIAEDATGDVIVGGSFLQSLDFGSAAPLTVPTGSTAQPVFVAKYDAGGNYQWSRQYGVALDPGGDGPQDFVGAITTDVAGHIWVGGQFGGTIDFGMGTLATMGDGELGLFVAELDGDGNALGATRFGDGRATFMSSSIAVGAPSFLGLAGAFQSTIDFGEGPLVSPFVDFCQFSPCSDGFLAAFSH